MKWILWIPLLTSLVTVVLVLELVRRHKKEVDRKLHKTILSVDLRNHEEVAADVLEAFSARFMDALGNQALILADQRGRIVSTAGAFQELFGYEPNEVWGQPLLMLMPERYHTGHLSQFGRAMGDKRRSVTVHGLRKDGQEFDASIVLGSFTTKLHTFFYGLVSAIPNPKMSP